MFRYSHISQAINTQEGLEGAILQSLLNFGRAHSNDEVGQGSKRGWWASEFLSGVGCRDWTLDRAKQTEETKYRVIHYTKIALDWLKPDIAKAINVDAWYENERLIRKITITLQDNTEWETTL